MPVEYDDPRKSAFLELFEVKYRGDVGTQFVRQIRAGVVDPRELCRAAARTVGQRSRESAASGWALGPGSIPAEMLTGIMRANEEAALGYAAYMVEWEMMTPNEKAAAKAPTKAAYTSRYLRGAR